MAMLNLIEVLLKFLFKFFETQGNNKLLEAGRALQIQEDITNAKDIKAEFDSTDIDELLKPPSERK